MDPAADVKASLKKAALMGQAVAGLGAGGVGFVIAWVACRVAGIDGWVFPLLSAGLAAIIGVIRVRRFVFARLAEVESLRDRLAAAAAAPVGDIKDVGGNVSGGVVVEDRRIGGAGDVVIDMNTDEPR
jgi:hypothetical protein